ncbi:hypothetical protein PG985_013631 [Apiospora marii]|uniref:uncharacterized protein n=1 Tax=Apiospora marii TaxID=335849 RepID=UPI00312F7F4D
MEVPTAPQQPTPGHDAAISNQNYIPPLLRLPRELRDMVYNYFVSVDQHFKWNEDYIPLTCPVLQINRQIRAEAWDRLIRSNVWIRVTMSSIPDYNWVPQACLLHHRAPIQYWDRLDRAVAVHLRLTGDTAAVEDHTFTFAYHPFTYGLFVHEISRSHWEYTGLSVEVKCATFKRVSKLIMPLSSVRDYRSVEARGKLNDDALQRLADQIRRTSNTIKDLVAIKDCYRRLGRRAERDGRHSDAISNYLLGIEATWDKADRFPRGSPEDNSINHINSDCFIAYSRNAHRHITGLKTRAPPVALMETATKSLLVEIIGSCSHALAFVGVTELQRCEAHLYRAFAFYHYAECHGPLLDRDDSRQLDREDPSVSPCRVQYGDCYLDAARCLFYAREVDCWEDVLAGLDEDDLRVLEAIQGRPGPQAFELVERQIPLVGPWRGDPDLWNGWPRHEGILMALFRRRHDKGPDGDDGVPPDLRSEYLGHGISWSYSGEELIANLFGIADASLLLTI